MYVYVQKRGIKMKAYIREHLKIIIIVTAVLLCTGLGIASPSIIAKMQPVLSESLVVSECKVKQEVYDYTGKEIKPKVTMIVFKDQENKKITKKSGEFVIKNYIDNVNVGQADIEISLDGYQGTIVIKDIFTIRPAKCNGLTVASTTRETIDLTWDETIGAEGYTLFRSMDGGQNFTPIYEGKAFNYQDTDIQLNTIYDYYVCAYMTIDEQILHAEQSDGVKVYTPLANPVISAVKNASYNTLRVEWPVVAGAAGYQVYRSNVKDGEYTLLTEITDGTVSAYDDATCECGKTYYYYIKVCQKTDSETIYGEASPSVGGKTTPNRVRLNGATTEGDTKVSLSWKKVSGAQGYEVYKNNKLVKTIENADTLSWAESGLSKEAEATYKVRAYCIVNNQKIFGSYSGTYEKEITIVYNYTGSSSEVSVLTQYAGRQYVFGGTSPTKGWDCSGFVQYAYAKHFGISLPRTSGEQVGRGTTVSKNDRSAWKPGDLLFYKENGRVSHVAVYLGDGQMIHALNSKYDTLIQGVDYYEKWDPKTSLYCVKRIF